MGLTHLTIRKGAPNHGHALYSSVRIGLLHPSRMDPMWSTKPWVHRHGTTTPVCASSHCTASPVHVGGLQQDRRLSRGRAAIWTVCSLSTFEQWSRYTGWLMMNDGWWLSMVDCSWWLMVVDNGQSMFNSEQLLWIKQLAYLTTAWGRACFGHPVEDFPHRDGVETCDANMGSINLLRHGLVR